MPITVTRTKVVLPRRRADLLSRQRLLDTLYDLLDCKLIIISAPAGYGKTSLILDFAYQVDIPACWYSLDTLDHDIQRFITYFIACIAQRFPSFGNQSYAALEAANPAELDLDRLVTAIVNDAYENIQEHFIIVLDDYHLVNVNKEIDTFINRFVQDIDENCHLVLLSRALLTLPDMPLMIARSQVGGLSFEELAFRPDEIQSLVLQNYQSSMPDTVAEELIHETEGWITGLLLTAHTMWQGMADLLRIARVSGIGLYEYLAQQVLEQQPLSNREFLLQSSLLEEFDAELCLAVLGDGSDWPVLIENVLQHNLFVLPLGEDGKWIRYHHLFRDFLQDTFEKEYPEQRAQILRRLADVYVQRNEWEKAYAACQRLGDILACAHLIERVGSTLITHGRFTALAEWIDALPVEVLNSHPNLLSLRGATAVIQGKLEHGLSLLNQAEADLRQKGDSIGLAHTLARRAFARRFMGRYSASLQDALEALSLSEQEEVPLQVKAESLRAIGMSLYHLGKLNEAVEKLKESLVVYTTLNDQQNVTTVLMELGLAYMAASRFREAMSQFSKAIHYWREVHNIVGQVNLLNNMAVLHHLMGEYERASELFSEGLAIAKHNGMSRLEAYILCGLGDLYADIDAVEAALDAYGQTRALAINNEDFFLLAYLDLMEAIQARNRGNIHGARRFLSSAEKWVYESSSKYETGLWFMEDGKVDLFEGQIKAAIDNFSKAANLFDQGGQRVEAARAYLYLAAAYYSGQANEDAFFYLNHAIALASTMDSQHVLVVAGRNAKPLIEAAQEYPEISHQASLLFKQVVQFERNIPSLRRRLRPHASVVKFEPPKITINAFGRILVERDGAPINAIEWQNQRKARELFFCLVAHCNGLSKEALGLIFWPDSTAGQLKLQFKNTIYRIRHALGQDVILFEDDRYWFNRELDYEYDVETFSQLVLTGRSNNPIIERIAAYRSALEICVGPYLPGVDGNWFLAERERLWQMYQDAVLDLARLYLEVGNYTATLDCCQRLLTQDPCLEEAHRLAMRAYAARGNRAAVMRQYERCQKALLEEVAAPPSSQTYSLYQTLIG
jgi:LuxR family transcriptional regulator, maltose regulon positive regulatory protein